MVAVRPAFIAVLFLLGGACGSGDDDEADDEPVVGVASTVPDDEADFFLTVSNQSFEVPSVFIEVAIDEERAIAEVFEVDGQHNFVGFAFDLEPGEHRLVASAAGGASIAGTFVVPEDAPHYGVLMFWTEEPRGPALDLQFMEQQPGFG